MRDRKKAVDRILVAIILVGSAFGIFLHYYDNRRYSKQQIVKMFEPVTSKYGIKIVYEVGDDFLSDIYSPVFPAGPAPDSIVKPIKHRLLARYPRILKKAFEKYPIEVIKNYLKGVYFAGEIDQHGFKAGGSYDPFRHIVFMVDNGGQTEGRCIGTFHHEFSSLLLRSHSFYLNPWLDQNPDGFQYLYETTRDKLKTFNSVSSVNTESDYEIGFMNSYGQTEFENDFNEYSAMIFTYPEKFKAIIQKYPRVRGKFLVWLKFYHMIDPVFTEAYVLGPDAK